MVALIQQIKQGASLEELRETVQERNRMFSLDVPGFRTLCRRFGSRAGGEDDEAPPEFAPEQLLAAERSS